MTKYFKIENNVITNSIIADLEFVSKLSGTWVEEIEGYGIGDIYENNTFSKLPIPALTEDEARSWRDMTLKNTDFIVPLTDFPNHAAWITYRQELRDWTKTSDFPDTKPTAPAKLN